MWLNENEHMTDAPKLPEVPVCGRRAVDERDLRIVGGKEAAPGSWDWQVNILNNQFDLNKPVTGHKPSSFLMVVVCRQLL